ncbi:hypothetical protein B566_EDAN008433 [Ephemera danica]|nr:hypothetical protein B566_EDAN008433 [Ephemera danica]
MKTRFNTLDIVCMVTELQRLVGLRVQQVYDIDHRTYLLKLQQNDEKAVLMMESGNRLHTTAFEWPKNMAPSSFSMKMRKHLKNKRLESLKQVGIDRAVDMQFGQGPAAYHIILELYDRGNIILTDCDHIILNVLRPHSEGEQIRFAVKEKYPEDRARQRLGAPNEEKLREILATAKPGDNLKKVLIPCLDYGPPLIEHVLLGAGLTPNAKISKGFDVDADMIKLVAAMNEAEEVMDSAAASPSKAGYLLLGYIIQKREKRVQGEDELLAYEEFHPMLFRQHQSNAYREMPSFDGAVDEFFSSLEGQKIELKALHQEREAVKKLENVRKDHDQRLKALTETQESDREKAELITRNHHLVDCAISTMRSALASQVAWPDIARMVQEAKAQGDPVASTITGLKLEVNNITMRLSDPYGNDDSGDEEDDSTLKPMMIDIDLDLNAHANARRYYDMRRNAAKKQQKTVESQKKALKSAERKTKQALKEVQTTTSIQKARKVFWFEKFFWFISSENYLVVGGRDQQQNEVVVRRYLKSGDIYVHADLQGASSVIIKNPGGGLVPPKTLSEAGVMATCYSVAWEAKVVAGAWWVHSNQVSKTAPTGEYLTTGSFMVRGKRNYLPPCQLAMGFGFLFRLEESSVARHAGERRVRTQEEEESDAVSVSTVPQEEEQEIELEGEDDEEDAAQVADAKEVLQHMTIEEEEEPKEEATEQDSESGSSDVDLKEQQKVEFPNTEIKTPLLTGNLNLLSDKDDEFVIGRSVPKKPAHSKPSKEDVYSQADASGKQSQPTQGGVKRGQKGKMKKLKEKYRDQDEEERQLRMQILQSAGSGKPRKEKKSGKDQTSSKQQNKQQNKKGGGGPYKDSNINISKPLVSEQQGEIPEQGEADADSDTEAGPITSDMETLNALTGQPMTEDELLFAVPVVAPYSTLTNYNIFTNSRKRGKAAKTALAMFLRDRTCQPRERDLLRSVKEQDLARNFPGKVKLSAPQLTKLRK